MSDTESFESVVNESFEIAKTKLQIAFEGKLFERLLSYLQAAHDREIRDVSQQQYARGFRDGTQQEYNRGYTDGQHSMDAEHRAIAMRLRGLRFDGGSHENLSRIAYAIYPCATGWTCESAAGLRDKLIDLMGGVSEPTFADQALDLMNTIIKESNERLQNDGKAEKPSNKEVGDDTCDSQCGGACDADCGDDFREQTEVSDGGIADDSAADSRGGSSGCDLHMAGVTYDVLDNERRKAIAELRKCDGGYTLEWDNIYEIFDALGVDYVGMTMAEVYDNLRDRLIHLLGGDQPSGIDVLREMDAESDTDGTSPNDDPTSSITDELRKWASDRHCKGISHTDVLNIGLIADRIDAQFDRICQQQEAVLQSIIDEVVEERKTDRLCIEKLEKQCDESRAKAGRD